MNRLTSLFVVLAIAATACVGAETAQTSVTTTAAATTSPSVAPTTPSTATTETDAPDNLALTDCDLETDQFKLFCEAYDILTTSFVDPLDPADLAAGAIEGMQEYGGEAIGTAPQEIQCAAPTEDFTDFCTVFAEESNNDIPGDALVEAAVRGMMDFALGDPNSTYLPPEAFEAFRSSNSGQIEGIGALVRGTNLEPVDDTDIICNDLSATCKLEIVTPLEGSPAEAAGILPGDYIVAVNGESVEGQSVDAVVLQVRGPAGSEVLLGVERDGQVQDITIERAPIVVPIVEADMLSDTIGYLSLAQFTATSPKLIHDGLVKLIDAGAENIIFDLQYNPGGLLDASVEIASEFIGDGLILSTQAPGETIEFSALPGGVATDETVKVYVLINRGSASASEVVAGALQDTGRATIIGENSFGKNTVQRQFLLDNGGALKLTIARWVTPDGNNYGITGLTPDVPVELSDDFDPQFLIDYTVDLINNG